jgi:hypothetical protein
VRLTERLLLISAGAILALCSAARAQSFQPGCNLPFDDIKGEDLKIDESCGIEGAGGSNEKIAENRAKNNFCASGQPASLTCASCASERPGRRTRQRAPAGRARAQVPRVGE